MKRPICAIAVLSTLGLFACLDHSTDTKRVMVLGFDGMDYGLTRQLMTEGRMPNFSKVAESGRFAALSTSIPAQSPVAWSTFMTGFDPGGHGIFDFIHRDPTTMTPYLSTTRTTPATRIVRVGRYQFPLTSARVELLRRGRAFWEVLEDQGIQTTIVRMPANFPPSGTATRELSGMGTPDIVGSYGTFSFYTSEPYALLGRTMTGGIASQVEVEDGIVRGDLTGPDNPFLVTPTKVRTPFAVYLDPHQPFGKLVIGAEERLLREGEWSDWVPVEFTLMPLQRVKAMARFYLKRVRPYLDLYVSPLNIDPLDPAMPISTPSDYAADLARATGRFYTQGMPEDTKALEAGVLTRDEFLAQAQLAADENIRQYRRVLDEFESGLLFYYFGHVDQVSHMMWRPRDSQHPAYDPAADGPYRGVIEKMYSDFDALVGETLQSLRRDDLLIVMSDHGFTSWRRSFHLNSWLRDNGYVTVMGSPRPDESESFAGVDWSRTRAYALGLNGLYINVKGREITGIVDPAERQRLVSELSEKLLTIVDPTTGERIISNVYPREQVYRMQGYEHVAPDLVIGYADGIRSSGESAIGVFPHDVLVDNDGQWSGDHCVDSAIVPGILLTSRALQSPAPSLERLAAAILAEFGADVFPTRE